MKKSYDYLGGSPEDEYRSFQQRNAALRNLGSKIRNGCKSHGNRHGVVCTEVDVFSDGTRMSASLWKPETSLDDEDEKANVFPALVLCHGWGGIRDGLEVRAREFSKAGFVVLTFDFRTWGDSDGVLAETSLKSNAAAQLYARGSDLTHGNGELLGNLSAHICRQIVDMEWQLSDIEACIDFLLGESCVNSKRIGIWGISQGGGHVLKVGARRRNEIQAIAAFVPSCGDVGAGNPRNRLESARSDAILRARGKSVLSTPSGVAKNHLPGMDGVPNLSKLVHYQPLNTVHLINCPVLIVDMEDEEIFDRFQNGKKAFDILEANGQSCIYETLKGRHYDAYDGRDGQFEQGNQLAINFFREYLQGKKHESKL